ncbi:MAG: Type 1 glutamine amidotransferase-like domain-containing protein, partial [Planctomyces sp.]
MAAVGGGELPAEIAASVVQTVGDNGTVVIIPDAAEDPVAAAAQAAEYLQTAGVKPAAIVGRSTALDDVVRGQVLQALGTARAVWIPGGQQPRISEAWHNTQLAWSLQQLLPRGGMIAGSSAGAAIMSR